MKKLPGVAAIVFLLPLSVGLLSACGDSGDPCAAGETKSCACSDGTASEQSCREDRTGFEPCDCAEYGIWCDPAGPLCWQTPQKDGYNPDDIGLSSEDARRYCEEIVLGGYDDWTLPDIDQLRTLVRGNPPNETGGACGVIDGSGTGDTAGCVMLPEYGGPGPGGCYWPAELPGTCDKPDPAGEAHPLEYWSSTRSADRPEEWVAFVSFESAAVGFNHAASFGDARCVRTGPSPLIGCEEASCTPGETRPCNCDATRKGAQTCAEERCFMPCSCTAFTPSDAGVDMCPTCDQIVVTITVPEKLEKAPYQLVAFLYADDSFPPVGPPEGGTTDTQVTNPEIDIDKPYVMTVPACTYYRERCLEGPHHLWVALIMSERALPIPEDGDYLFGLDADPIRVNEGPQKTIELEIELAPFAD